ncbi:MAG TPA: hypothetical protein VGB55_10735, partial [Tepidisphaeraceae bacterium]
GADATKTIVTGTMKFDTAPQEGVVSGADELAAEMNLRSPLWVCGSTGPGEEQIALNAHKTLLEEFPDLQLAIIPRKPKRFDEVANLIVGNGFLVVRRSGQGKEGVGPLGLGLGDDASQSPKPQGQIPVVLGDTMGELRKFYARADVVFVGRSLVDLGEKQHGSDMIEPAALAKPTIVGPFTGNFAEVMNAFEAASAMIRITPPEEDPAAASALLAEAVGKLLRDPGDLGTKARDVVQANVGATARTMEQIIPLLPAN